MAYYYLKLYHEILDDPKMGRLPDHLYRRVIEIFLMASASDGRDGYLPSVEDMAWRLHADTQELLADLIELEKTGIIQNTESGWHVTNFVKRQAAVSGAERIKRYREREHSGNEVVTDRYTELRVKNKNIDIEEIKTQEAATSSALPSESDLLQYYTMTTGMMTFPAGSYGSDLNRLAAIYSTQRGAIVEYLRPFWDEWVKRNYSRSNTAWLDWAVAGHIPERKTQPNNGSRPGVEDTLERLEKRRTDGTN